MTPTTISEAEARIEAALKVARERLSVLSNRHMGGHYVEGSSIGKDTLADIISILEDH